MLEVILIDKAKNSVVINLLDDEYKTIFKDKINVKSVKKHRNKGDLHETLREFISTRVKND